MERQMEQAQKLEQLFSMMTDYYRGDPHQIQHFIKVHSFARRIGLGQGLDAETQETLEIAALLHDIGIKTALEKYGTATGSQQEQEGPPLAKAMLERLGYPPGAIERVCYLVGHHHSYATIDGDDYQILVEADFLVNMHENQMSAEAIQSVLGKIFRTQTGIEYCRVMFDIRGDIEG